MQHGGDLRDARRRVGAELDWLDLSTGINPHPWPIPPDAPAHDAWARLPSADDRDALLAAARRAYAVPAGSEVVAAPGTQALIQWLPHVAPPGDVAVVGPTYGEHEASWRDAGRSVVTATAFRRVEADGNHGAPATRHVVVVNPNNPDGRIVPRRDLLAAARDLAGRGGWLVIDESFADVTPEASLIGQANDLPVVVLRSFGKFYGLAGLRIGFAIGPRDIVAALARRLGPWAVSGPALALGRLALDDLAWADAMRWRLAGEARALDTVLASGASRMVGGTSLFRLVRHPQARRLHAELARSGIWVRAFDWADDLLRIGLPPNEPGLERLATAWRALA